MGPRANCNDERKKGNPVGLGGNGNAASGEFSEAITFNNSTCLQRVAILPHKDTMTS